MRNVSKTMSTDLATEKLVLSNFTQSQVFAVDGLGMQTYPELLIEFSKKLRFPEYFGHNMNALYDCLADLSWLKSSKILVLVERSELVLSQENSVNGAKVLSTIFTDAIAEHSEKPRNVDSEIIDLHLVMQFSSKNEFERLESVPQF